MSHQSGRTSDVFVRVRNCLVHSFTTYYTNSYFNSCSTEYCNRDQLLLMAAPPTPLPLQVCKRELINGLEPQRRWTRPCAGNFCIYKRSKVLFCLRYRFIDWSVEFSSLLKMGQKATRRRWIARPAVISICFIRNCRFCSIPRVVQSWNTEVNRMKRYVTDRWWG